MRKWILRGLGALVALAVLMVLIGSLLPRGHVATSSIVLREPPASVWEVVRALEALPDWFGEIRAAHPDSDPQGQEAWRYDMQDGFVLRLVVVEEDPPQRLVTEIAAGEDAAFGGRWIYEIAPGPAGTTVTLTEDGWIANPLFRLLANTVFGLHGTIDAYLRDLGAHFGEVVSPQHLE